MPLKRKLVLWLSQELGFAVTGVRGASFYRTAERLRIVVSGLVISLIDSAEA